ncbi:MAG: BamA/TamA family outer membrane protein [Bacteroidales bacterium]|nr:BamA/TamA family outer membrane protein [Bacteroidales bacterium]
MKLKSKIVSKINFIPLLGSWGGILFILLLAACSGTKHLPAGEKLYTGAEIKLESSEKVNKRFIKTAVNESFRTEPNKSYFGMRPQLWLYMAAGENPDSKFKKWLRKRGEAPVLMSNVNPRATAAVIDARLFNLGIFDSYTEFKIVEKKSTASVIYSSHVHKPYIFKDFVYNISPLNPLSPEIGTQQGNLKSLSDVILSDKGNSFIKTGEDYNLDILKAERIRIDALLKNKGYFYFNPDYLLFKADTSTIHHTISLELTLKDSISANALAVYRINKVFIDQNYSLKEEARDSTKDTLMVQNTIFLGKESEMNIHPKVILRSVYLRKHEIYSRENHNITLNRLMSMGNFKFVQLKFSDSDTTASGYLDATILLTPMTNHTFRAELDLVSKSNNYTGPRMNLSLLNRNTFKGAELLNLALAGSFEAQLSGANKNLFSYSVNPQIDLTFPRFLVPFNIKPSNSIYVPKTTFSLSYNFLKRVNYFDMSVFQFTYGFKWKTNIRTEHEFNPISIGNTSVSNESTLFTALLAANPFLKKSYEEQFIAGGNYSFTYNEQVIAQKKIQYFLHFTAETAGNLFSLAELVAGNKPKQDNPSTIAGSIYSQYAKLSVDGRAYYNFKDDNKIALRVFAGVANSYGNSSTLPYSKQFFSGGPNSIRAFRINSLGPGTYLQNAANTGFLQLGGDIKLETNAEYRFGIYRFLKGALFVDAGNVWLQKSNPSTIGTPFAFSGFMNELAVGAGIGLRVDVSFFALRFDVAMPLRKPWLEDNHRWVINQINFGNSIWRRDNLVLNIAIGYPF